ncbi:MAG TPA: hypothetical protein DCP63_14030 [Bacteroidetes bacterium]|nr:hypothetical protein [Bacteroidota bacterium]
MKIRSLFQSRRRTPDWTYDAGGTIWRILFSEAGRIIGECRHQDQKLATFFCLDETTGSALWQERRLEEPWWIGIEAIQENVLLLHEYAKPDLPQHKKIHALDVESGKELWKSDHLGYWFGFEGRVYCLEEKFEKRIGYGLDLQTGMVEETYEESLDELGELRERALDALSMRAFRFPENLDPGSDSRERALARKVTKGANVVGHIEFIKEQGYILLGYHAAGKPSKTEAPLFQNRFVIIDAEDGKTVFEETLARDVRAIVPDSFFAKPPFVYFIKDQKALSALCLWKS